MIALIIIGDILVCGFLVGLVAWLFLRADDEKMNAAARIPLDDECDFSQPTKQAPEQSTAQAGEQK